MGDLIGNRIPNVVAKSYDNKITKVSKNQKIPKKRYISLEERKNIADDVRLI